MRPELTFYSVERDRSNMIAAIHITTAIPQHVYALIWLRMKGCIRMNTARPRAITLKIRPIALLTTQRFHRKGPSDRQQ